MRYAQVILPLPLADTFTYALPAPIEDKVQVGCRLIVPFGVRKMYAGVVTAISDQAPEGNFRIKEALELLDVYPVVTPMQLQLWRWIADYYLCTIGDVLKAAMPSGMKLESESIVVLNADYDNEEPLSRGEQILLEALEQKPEQKVGALQEFLPSGNVLPLIKRLLDKGIVIMKEAVRQTYKAKTVRCVRLTEDFFDEAKLEAALREMKQAHKQLELLDTYLLLSRADVALKLRNRQLLVEVERAALLEQAGSPTLLRALKERGILEIYDKAVTRLSTDALPQDLVLHPLSDAQQQAFDDIHTSFEQHDITLLHGVTGSGKTEVYIHLIREALSRGGQVLYLLPEIVLTAQLVDRLRRVFGNRLGVYHSKYADAERVEVWQKQLGDEPYDIVVGVRSSVFLPFRNLQLVIVDEEHETSFKQQDPAPRYHGRSVALVLAQMSRAKTLLGTATPSVESYYLAQTGRYGLVRLEERYSRVQLPEIVVADVKELRRKKEMKGFFSPQLLAAMRDALERKEQVILFQNRRGYSPHVDCHTCGWTPRCQHCDVSLTYHKGANQLSCHYCGAVYAIPDRCPNCGDTDLRHQGYGTERIQDEIQALFPEARVGRMDLDTTRSKHAYEQLIADFQHGRLDILVGTQMVTKGLDFERVSVVGILSADAMLNIPDFRSYERAFQMMVQVAGRAGRRRRRGLVVLQTYSPDNEVICQVCLSDFDAMYHQQMAERELFNYPPMSRIVYVFVKHKDQRVAHALATEMAQYLRRIFDRRVLGPDTPSVGRVQTFYIRKIMLKIEVGADMRDARRRLREVQAYLLAQPAYKSAQVYYDADPV